MVGNNLIYDYTAVTFSLNLAILREKLEIFSDFRDFQKESVISDIIFRIYQGNQF